MQSMYVSMECFTQGQRSDESMSAGTETGALNFITYLKRHTARAAR
jgi:hypothetical protein